jgi:hypothetical protein
VQQHVCYAKPIVTNPVRDDGFGAQFQTIIYSVIYAELNDLEFVYTPFKDMEHNYESDTNFLAKKEWLINFIDNFEINKGNAIQQDVRNVIQFFEGNLDKSVNSLALKKIKEIFRSNKNSQNYFNNQRLNIAIHMRRSNLHDSRVDGTDTPDDFFLNIINKLRVIYAPKNPLLHIYSQGNDDDFKKFCAQDIVLHLNESIEDTFTSMVLADVLVTGRSSFSYTAGILSGGAIYYIPFWCPALPHWISINELLK